MRRFDIIHPTLAAFTKRKESFKKREVAAICGIVFAVVASPEISRAYSNKSSTELIHATGKTDTKIISRRVGKQARRFRNLQPPNRPANFQSAMVKSLTYQRQPYQGEPLPNCLNVGYGSSLGGNSSTQQRTVMISPEIDLASYSRGRWDVPQAQITNEPPLDSPQLLSQGLQSPEVPFTWDPSYDDFSSSPLDVDKFLNSPTTNDTSFPTSTSDNASLSLPAASSSSPNAVHNLFFNSVGSNVFRTTHAGTSTSSAVPTSFASPLRAHCPPVSRNIILQLHPWIPRQVDPKDAGPGNIGMSKSEKVAESAFSKIVRRFRTILPRGSEAIFDHNPELRFIPLMTFRKSAVTPGVKERGQIVKEMVERLHVLRATTISAIPRSLRLVKCRHSFLVPNSAENTSWCFSSYGIDIAFLLAMLDWINNEVEKNKGTTAASLDGLRECIETDLLRLLENCSDSKWWPHASRALVELRHRWATTITAGDPQPLSPAAHGRGLSSCQPDCSLVPKVLSLLDRSGSATVSSSESAATLSSRPARSRDSPLDYRPLLEDAGESFCVKSWDGKKIAEYQFSHLLFTKPGACCLVLLKLINCAAEMDPPATSGSAFDKLRLRVASELDQMQRDLHGVNALLYRSVLSRRRVLDKQWSLLRYGTQTEQGVMSFPLQ